MEDIEVIKRSYRNNHDEQVVCGIEVCPLFNTIKFTVKGEGYLYAYVVGGFNNWKISNRYKLAWQVDITDGKLKMMKEVKFINGLKSGEYKYKYILIDCFGNEKWLDCESDEKRNFNFKWESVEDKLEIYTSNDIVTSSASIELVGVCSRVYGQISFPKVIWSLENEITGVTITGNYLTVDETVPNGTEILLNANTIDNKLFNSKKIIVSTNSFKGTLVHFYVDNNDYIGNDYIWSCWVYGNNTIGKEVNLNMKTDFGISSYVQCENLIMHKKKWGYNWKNDWVEQSNTFQLMNKENIYIISNDNRAYFSLKEALISRYMNIKSAVIDNNKKIKIILNNKPLLGSRLKLYINGNEIKDIIYINHDKEVIIKLHEDINANDLIVVSPSDVYKPFKVQIGSYLDKFYYSKDDLGVSFFDNNVSFKLWAPVSIKVELLIFNKWNSDINDASSVYNMIYDNKTGVFSLIIDREICEGKYYLYKLYFNDIDEYGSVIYKITYAVDPYSYFVGVNGDKGFVFDINDNVIKHFKWKRDIRPSLKRKEDSIIYEIHIRDFTIDKSSGVKDFLKGTYLGAVEENTIYKDDTSGMVVKTGLDHLIELGITHVHLLPVFDFGSVDERFSSDSNRNWGYDPKNFNVPEGSYSTNPYNPITRVREFREMIMKFHSKGIRVVMDMVYNHMISTTNMENIVPGYYFRRDSLGRYTNGSGCGNEIDTERPMVRKFIVDSCIHWIKDYHIDGLRFDLMELIDLETIKEIVKKSSKIDKNFIVYGEPWKGGESSIINGTFKGSQKNQDFSIFNDVFRDSIRGDNSPSKGFVNGNNHSGSINWSIIEGLKGSVYTLTYKPRESINYIDAHDNYTLWDQIEKSQNIFLQNNNYRMNIPNNPLDSVYVRQSILGSGIILTAQGIPFIQGGSEFLRTKQGDHNSYKSSDYINSIKWKDKIKFNEVFKYYKGLLDIRKNLPYFTLEDPNDIKNKINFTFANNDDNSGVIISHINLNDINKGEALVIYNGTSIDDYDVNKYLPKPKSTTWKVIVNHYKANLDIINEVSYGNVPTLKAFSLMILYSK